MYEGGALKKTELSSGPLPLGECSRNPSVSVYRPASLGEAAHSFSEFFFEDSPNVFAHFMMGDLQAHLPTQHCVQQFSPKMAGPPCPTLPTPDLTPRDFFFCFPGGKKSSKGNILPMWRRCKQKTAEALKGIKTDEFKNWFEQWKNVNRCITSNGEYFEGD